MARTQLTLAATASYVHVFEPHAIAEGQAAKFSTQLVFAPGYDFGLVNAAIQEAITDKWGANPPLGLKLPVVDPMTKPKLAGNPFYQGGKYYISANALEKPFAVYHNGQEIMDARELYSGCSVKASVHFYAYDRAGNQGVACSLDAIMKVADGDRLDNRMTVEAMFGADIDPNAVIATAPMGAAPAVAQPQYAQPAPVAVAPAPAPQYAQPVAVAPVAPPQYAPAPVAPAPAPVAPPLAQAAVPHAAPVVPITPAPVAPGVAPAINPATGLPY